MTSTTAPGLAASHCYVCEAGSIQDYLLASNRLRDIVGGSELLEMIWQELREAAVDACGQGHHIRFARKAGGAFYALSESAEALDAFQSLFSLAAEQFAPELILQAGRGEGTTPSQAFKAAMRASAMNRNRPSPQVPVSGPYVQQDPRTGRAAVGVPRRGLDQSPMDAPTARFIKVRENTVLARGGERAKTLTDKFAPHSTISRDAWPRKFEADDEHDDSVFPFEREPHYIGLIYADGSGMAKLTKQVQDQIQPRESSDPDAFIKIFGAFSSAITDATERAAAAATAKVLLPAQSADGMLPARPIVLGGDDLAIVVRADLAVSFALSFLATFESESAAVLAQLAQEHQLTGLPQKLTAGAGIVFAKSSQPYHLLHVLAEDICTDAKNIAKKAAQQQTAQQTSTPDAVPSVIAWHRLSTSLHGDWDTIVKEELTTPGANPIQLTLAAYAVGGDSTLPSIEPLLALKNLLAPGATSRSPMRSLLTALSRDPATARREYQRWREVQGKAAPALVRQFDQHLNALLPQGTETEAGIPCSRAGEAPDGALRYSPIGDVLALIAVGDTSNCTQPTEATCA